MPLDSHWNFDPLQIVPLCVIAAAYVRRCGTLSIRGRAVPMWRQVSFILGVVIIALSLISPIDTIGETQLFSVHMIQHLLLGDLGPLFMALGLTGPILRPLLAIRPLQFLEKIRTPQVAFVAWIINLYAWHIPFMYDLALQNNFVHAFEHVAFTTTGLLVWLAIFEPIPGPVWFGALPKVGFVVGMRFTEALLANIFIWSSKPFYQTYIDAPRTLGWSAAHDQGMAGVAMIAEGSIVTAIMIVVLLWKAADESVERQRLIELGVPAERARRAARFGRTGARLEAEVRDTSDRVLEVL